MAKVAVFGASGSIGFDLACALRRDGFYVYGIIRDSTKAKRLWEHEIHPIVADISKLETYQHLLAECGGVIDTTAPDYESPFQNTTLLLTAYKALARPTAPKHFIYTSGVLVHGHSEQVVDETTPPNPSPFYAWRIALEEKVLSESTGKGFATTVVRPGFVYGNRGGRHVERLFAANVVGDELVITGNPNRRYPWIHVDDLAAAYVAVLRNKAASDGEIFDVGLTQAEPYVELARKAAAVAGKTNLTVRLVEPATDLARASNITVLVASAKARTVLSWAPKHLDISQELSLHYQAWKANAGI